MTLRIARFVGITAGVLAFIGLLAQNHIFGIMNSDDIIDIARLGVALALIYAGYAASSTPVSSSLLVMVGIGSLGVGLVGALDRSLLGLLPSGLTYFDIALHVAIGMLAIWAGVHYEEADVETEYTTDDASKHDRRQTA